MKKLKELSVEELVGLYDKNNGFNSAVFEQVYEQAMFWQGEEYKLMGAEVFDYHDHYSSFFLTTPMHYGVKDGRAVAHKLDREYMTKENAELYDELNRLTDELENMECDEYEDKRDEYDEKIDELCDKLADGLTMQLRALETIDMEHVRDELQMIADGEHYMSEWETDGTTVYEHMTKEYK